MRKAKPKIRIILPDPKFNDVLVTQFVNNMMKGGKKSTAYKLFYEAMDIVAEKTTEDPVEIWKKALANVTPAVEVRSRRIGGATFQIPSEIPASRKMSIGMKNLINFSRKRHEKSMGKKLAGEIIAAHKEEGAAFKKKEDTHRMAEANKAFSHFRF
jgi:small subunit ribosomal protein S7